MKKVYIIAGEASGDLHASNLMKAMKSQDAQIDFRFWGGDLMQSVQSNGLVKHIKDLAFMGFVEVLMNIRTILGNIKVCKNDIEAYNPDVLVLVDYPGFNLRIAEWAKQKGIKVVYYISPQVWAWKENRVKKIRKSVDRMLVILPFEKPFYAKHNMEVDFVGHPLLDAIENYSTQSHGEVFKTDLTKVAILPGSRTQEISVKLPIMLKALEGMMDLEIVIAGAPSQTIETYKPFIGSHKVVFDQTYDMLSQADYALVTSGTATLETALFRVPQVVCYKGSQLSYWIAKRLVKINYISLVNLIMDKEVVTELIQQDCNPTKIAATFQELRKPETTTELKKEYDQLIDKLGGGGASTQAAKIILEEV